jgi:positive regulator of sigma E activity
VAGFDGRDVVSGVGGLFRHKSRLNPCAGGQQKIEKNGALKIMAEFKFACPQCKQHIQCDTCYAGSEINCPGCRQIIIVPSAPKLAASGERTIQIKVSTLRRSALIVLCALLTGGVMAIVIYALGNSMRTIWTDWTVFDGNKDQWGFVSGKIHAHSEDGEGILASEKQFGDVTYSATVSTTNREASLAVRMQDAGNGYIILFAPARTPCPWNTTGFIAVVKKVSGTETTLASNNKRNLFATGQTARIKVIARGPVIEVQLNGTRVLRVNDSTYSVGRIGLRIFGTSDYPCDSTFSKVTFF